MKIEKYNPEYLDVIVGLSLRAWAPVFDSMQKTLAPEVYDEFYPNGWEESQRESVKQTCTGGEAQVWVGMENDAMVGFIALKLDVESKFGEIYMIAVDPDYQRQGFASKLTTFATDHMKEAGITIAMVETGGDPGHAPARSSYESMGFKLWPVARYFKKL